MQFAVEAMRPDGTTVTERLEAHDRDAALDGLRSKGLVVLRLNEAGTADAHAAPRLDHGAKIRSRDVILLTRQLKMLLEAGAPLVPALEAAAEQTAKPGVRAVLGRLRERVEEGDSLSDALEAEHGAFNPVFCTMIAAGEATASLPQVFGRLCQLTQQQLQTRKMVLGAMIYPSLLSILLTGVVIVLLTFVVPRFRPLFETLRTPLPVTTHLLFAASEQFLASWPYILGGVLVGLGVLVAGLRSRQMRVWLDELAMRLPIIGRVMARLIFARVLRVWAAMLRCHVPLLETIRQSREAITNVAFLRLLSDVEERVASGGRMGQALAATGLADPVIVSALRTGEDNGRLAEAAEFVSDWMDEDNTSTLQHLTKLAEPVLLVVMGLVVGFVAMSLFLPLFDLAAATG
jgi:type II secretory pathway component PulF